MPYEAGDFRHLSLCGDDSAVEEIGQRVWISTLYVCGKEGNHPINGGRMNLGCFQDGKRIVPYVNTNEGRWKAISLERCFLSLSGA